MSSGSRYGKVTQHVLVGHAFGKHGEDVSHPYAKPPDTGPAAALVRVHRDTFEEIHLWHGAFSGAAKSTCPAAVPLPGSRALTKRNMCRFGRRPPCPLLCDSIPARANQARGDGQGAHADRDSAMNRPYRARPMMSNIVRLINASATPNPHCQSRVNSRQRSTRQTTAGVASNST